MQGNKPFVPANRSIPFNLEAEEYVLGSIFIENQIIGSLVGKITDEDFYDEKNQKIFTAMVNLHKRQEKIEILTVIEELKRINYRVDDNLSNYLVQIVDDVPSTASVDLYLELVEEKSLERILLSRMRELSDDILNSKLDFNALLDKVEDKMIEIIKQRRSSEFMTLSEAAAKVYDQVASYVGRNKELTGLDTGYANLNKVTLGLQKGDLMILAARPSVGKSTFALNLALQVAKCNNASVAFFSLEMSIEQILMRIFSYQATLDLTKIRSGNLTPDDLILLSLAKEELSKINLYFDENSSTNLADIRTKCRQLKQAGKLDFLIIDYLQLITNSNNRGNRQEEVSQISRQLKTLAQELDIPILALSQLSRSIEGREDKEPKLADLRESGSIEQDADMVMFLFRRSDVEEQEVADALQEKVDELDKGKKDRQKLIEIVLSIAKNRQGPLGKFDYHFYGHIQRFSEQKEFKPFLKKKKDNATMRRLNANN